MFQRFVVLTNAAVEGARVATLPGYLPADAIARAQAYATGGGVSGAVNVNVANVTLPGPSGGAWAGVTVTVQHVYRLQYVAPIATLVGGSMAANVTLTPWSYKLHLPDGTPGMPWSPLATMSVFSSSPVSSSRLSNRPIYASNAWHSPR